MRLSEDQKEDERTKLRQILRTKLLDFLGEI